MSGKRIADYSAFVSYSSGCVHNAIVYSA